MKKRNTIRVALLAVILSCAFLLLRSASPAVGKGSSCKESLKECCKKKEAGSADKTTWENLSRQFFSTI